MDEKVVCVLPGVSSKLDSNQIRQNSQMTITLRGTVLGHPQGTCLRMAMRSDPGRATIYFVDPTHDEDEASRHKTHESR